MGIEIRITGSTPLESLSTLAAAANYCMSIPAVREAANIILTGDHSATTAHHEAPVPVSANVHTAPAPAQSVNQTVTPAPQTAAVPQTSVPPVPAPGTFPVYQAPAGVPGAGPGNPTMPGAGMSAQTSLFNGQTAPAPGAGPLPVAAPTFTAEQVGKAGADLVTQNPAKRDELNGLLRQYGVQTISELKPEALGPFALALRGMGAKL